MQSGVGDNLTNCLDSGKCCSEHHPVPKPLPELPPEVWHEIFQFATHLRRSASLRPSDPFTTRRVQTWSVLITQNTPVGAMRTKIALSNVCKAWRACALPILYHHIVIKSPMRAKLILRTLEESRRPGYSLGHGQWTRHLEVLTYARGSSNLQYLQDIFAIFRRCHNVRVLSGIWNHALPSQFLDAVAKLYGPCLEELYWNEIAVQVVKRAVGKLITVATLEFLGAFTHLQTLDLRHFKSSGFSDPGQAAIAERPVLSQVGSLVISTNAWSIAAASGIALPRLRSLSVKVARGLHGGDSHPYENDLVDRFIKAHGRSVESVDIHAASPDDEMEQFSLNASPTTPMNPAPFLNPDGCPNLTSICYPVLPDVVPLPEYENPVLRRIGLRDVKSDLLYITRDKPENVAKDHLLALLKNANKYPNLELVQTIGLCVGKSSTKDVFIWWTEQFARKGILFLDGEGVFWEYEDVVAPNPAHPASQKAIVTDMANRGIICWKMMD